MSPESIVELLDLRPHPEGGYFREIYRSSTSIDRPSQSGRVETRSVSTAIYYLLLRDRPSPFHRIRSDEIWHFYGGDPIDIHVLDGDGCVRTGLLGPLSVVGRQPMRVVPSDRWFGAEVAIGGEWGLVGCTVAPGFDFADFEMSVAEDLAAEYPKAAETILRLSSPLD